MRKYLFRYLLFWLPAYGAAMFFSRTAFLPGEDWYALLGQVTQWFFAFFMVFGWAVNTGMAAYRFPRTVLSVLLIYTGTFLLVINFMRNNPSGELIHTIARNVGGSVSMIPLDIFIVALLDINIDQEYWVMGGMMALCLAGYIVGLVTRRIHPNPYRPRILDRG